MTTITLLNIGFSILSAAILFTAYVFFLKNVNKSWFAILSCAALLLSLIAVQYGHLRFLIKGTDLLKSDLYKIFLFTVPVTFYYFSQSIIFPEKKPHLSLLLHIVPPTLLYLFVKSEIAITLLFITGVAYSAWLAHFIYSLRQQRARFKAEIFFFGLFAITALFVLIVGVSIPYIDNTYFYYFYANSISLCFILIVAALIVFPEILNEIADVIKLNYATSTLKDTNIDDCMVNLKQLMQKDKIYQNENLNLSMLAKAMNLSSHQLSELINVQFNMSFSKYIREQRINLAKELLSKETDTSILVISLESGFKSQSNFYAAFKEITGMSPGAYRKSLYPLPK